MTRSLPIDVYRPSPRNLEVALGSRRRPRFDGLEVSVVGAGKSGLSAARLLAARGAQVHLADDRPYDAQGPSLRAEFPPERFGPLVRERLGAADLVVLSPGVPRSRPELSAAIERGVLVGEVELASWFTDCPLIGITGTNGKSTTTALIGHILETAGHRVFVGGNLGRPATEMASADFDVGVLELSSYQLESLSTARFRVGLWLNLTPDHLDRYPDVAHYAAAKARLMESIEPGGVMILNAEDPFLVQQHFEGPGLRWFETADVGTDLAAPALPGRHNRSNIAAAIAAVETFSVSREVLRRALASFPGLPHRLERVRELDGVVYVNDSKATNVDSAVTAVLAMPNPKILIAGGKDKGASWGPLVEASRASVRAVLAIGQASPVVLSAFQGQVPSIELVGDLDHAVQRAQAIAQRGDVVLLSPACASFDQFDNFEHRGDEFRRMVNALAPTRSSDV